jgi:hypothetical protein
VVVLDEVRIPLVGLAAQESVEALEPPPERPTLAVAALGDILLGNVEVLAQPEPFGAGSIRTSRSQRTLLMDT